MNEQKLFDASLKHIRKQGAQSSAPGVAGTCVYRTSEGLSCGFAPAIEKYDTDLEGSSALDLLDCYPEALYPEYRKLDRQFAIDIQMAHDDWEETMSINFLPFFEERMRFVALQHGLEYSS